MKTPLLIIAGSALLLLSGCREDDKPAATPGQVAVAPSAVKPETHPAKPVRPQVGMVYEYKEGKSFLRFTFLTMSVVELRVYDPGAGGEGWSGGSDTRHSYAYEVEKGVLVVHAPDLQVYEIGSGVLSERSGGMKLAFEENPVEPPPLQMKVQLGGF